MSPPGLAHKSSHGVIVGAMEKAKEEQDAKENPPLKIALISWNMANGSGGDVHENLLTEIKAKNGGRLPDIVVIATQEEGLNFSGNYLSDRIDAKFNGNSNKREYKHTESFSTMTGAPGRVSLTVLTQPGLGKVDIEWETEKALNKGGIGCHVTVQGHHFSFSGMHLDSNKDSLKVKAASGMVRKLESDKDYLTYDIMVKRSTEFDVMMGDMNHRHVEESGDQHYDPLGPNNYLESGARYLAGLGLKPVKDENEEKGELAQNTYASKKKSTKIRLDGAEQKPYYQEGALDRILISGSSVPTPVTVVDTNASDHKPIVSVITTTAGITKIDDFERTRDWVIRKIENYASSEVIERLRKLTGAPSDHTHLERVFNYYKCVRDLALEAEECRFKKDRDVAQYTALVGGRGTEKDLSYRKPFQETLDPNTSNPGLVQGMIKNGNEVFQNKDYLNPDSKSIDTLNRKTDNKKVNTVIQKISSDVHAEQANKKAMQAEKTKKAPTSSEESQTAVNLVGTGSTRPRRG